MKMSCLWAVLPLAVLAAPAFAAQPCMRHVDCGNNIGHGHKGCYGYAGGYTCEEAYYDNAIWPRQYIAPSRRGICQATELMINNGWRRHNILSSFHFDANTGELSEAGRLKVEWILTQAAPNRRTIYIERTANQDKTAERLQAVQELAANLASGAADVQETHIRDHGHPASAVDAVFTGFSANQLIPALPPSATAGGAVGATAAP